MSRTTATRLGKSWLAALAVLGLAGCETAPVNPVFLEEPGEYEYKVGPGDSLNIFVWRNPEVSSDGLIVRPDGKISTPLVEDLVAAGKTPTQLAREVEQVLSQYIKEPLVTVMPEGFVGLFSEQIRIVGEASKPQALPYRTGMTLLDVMIAVGGLTDFADGNKAVLTRQVEGKWVKTLVRLDDLVRDGDIDANLPVQPGDVLLIPESWF
ncbi:MAG: polysaccharide export protein [Gammaproteobacteria bacterium]|nr:polysaccharide export protein [Gammaproteobacteria bacterium]